ncbi:deleted in malignant brain tumors 1 protein-like [Saccostrea cucullata]|uniref:deleted in malignant brain tumors 1 protein-like n=1 Tax=Saccostrea cuccullata TaxID=36930 RepID=UPI002ED02545
MGRHSILSIICYCIIIGGLSFTFTKGSPCGLRFTSYNGQITSPNYPSSYSSNLDCKWTIVRHTDQEIFLSIRDFTTESCCDRLIITDRNTGHQIAKLRGNCSVVGDGWFSTSSNNIELHFITDGSVNNQGFHITFKSQSRYSVTVPDIPTTSFVCDGKTIPEVNATTTYGITGDVTTHETTYGPRFTIGYSHNVRFEYGSYGRVSLYGQEICYTGVTYQTGVALCRSKGYSFSSFNSVSPRNYYYNAYEIQCYSSYINDCYFRERTPCSSVLYLNCYSSSTTESFTRTWRETSADYTIESVDVRIEYGSYGRIYVEGQEVCSSTYNYRYGEVLCRAKGYPFSSSFSSVTPRDHYNTVNIRCYSDYLSSCSKEFRYNYCSSVVVLYCYEDTTTQAPVYTSEYPGVSVGYSNVYIQHGMYGRVYIDGTEVCADDITYQTRETFCLSKGYGYYSYNSYNANQHYRTIEVNCSNAYLKSCSAEYRPRYCSRTLYLTCGHASTERYYTKWLETTTDSSIDSVDVRIEYGTNGRVYIKGHEVCTSTYNYRSGEALCRSKGYFYSTYTSTSARNHYNTYEISCSSGYLPNCSKGFRYNYCSSVIYIYCHEATTSTQQTTMEYSGVSIGYSSVYMEHGKYGRVYVNGFEVCADGVTNQTYEALCQSKGYHFYSYNSSYANNPYRTLDINCSDTHIDSCSAEYRSQYCWNALYLDCDSLGIRLMGTGYPWEGTIEILHNGQWGTICDDSFDKQDGDVICRMLGYSHSRYTYQSARYGQGSGPIWLDNLDCNGYESDVAYCSSNGWGRHNCGHSEDAGVYCTNSTEYETTPYDPCSRHQCYNGGTCFVRNNGYPEYYCICPNGYTGSNCYYEATTFDPCYGYPCRHGGTCYRNYGYPGYYCTCANGYTGQHCDTSVGIRLLGTVYPWAGTIEILHNGQWGTICDDSFDKQDGDVICRMLGYSQSRYTYHNARYGQGSGPIWLDNLGCNGYESDVAYCSSNGWGRHDCGHSEDAGVYCTNSTEYETTPYDPCSRYQCYNGGTCFVRNNGYPEYYCICPSGYTGSNCLSYYEISTFDPCYGYPCRHGGTCYRNYGYQGYYCACANGYTGQHCDTSVGFSAENSISVACTDNTWDISVYLPPFYNRYSDFNPNDIYLGTDSCTGYVNGNYLHFRSDYSACDTTIRTLTDHVVYTNQLVYALHDPNHHYIIHEYRFRVPVDCYLKRNEAGSGHFNHGHDVTMPSAHHVTGSTHHSVHIQFYTDSTFRYTKPLYGSRVGDRVYVKAYTDVRDYNLKMRISDCFTTPTPSEFSSMKYFIIQNGCVIDPNARILSQTTHETRFYFQDFEYSTNHDSLYLHCNATFCKSNDYSASCEQACSHPRKRVGGGDIIDRGPVESMAVNEAVRLTKADDIGSSSSRGSSTVIAILSVIFGIILITVVTFMVLGKIKRIRQKKTQVV